MTTITQATPEQAPALAHLINLAGGGIPAFFWQTMVEGKETPMEVGARRAARTEGGFSYIHARVLNTGDHLAAMLIAYRQPNVFDLSDIDDYPSYLQPMVKLEAAAPGSWYINALATHANFQRQGFASRLLVDTEIRARENHCDTVSIMVASENPTAKSLYEKFGFVVQEALPVVPIHENFHGGDWLLMTKKL